MRRQLSPTSSPTHTPTHTPTIAGALYAGVATTIVGSSVAAASLLVRYPPLASQALRYAIGALALGVILCLRRQPLPRLRGRDFALVLALAATGLIAFSLCLLAALQEADPAAVDAIVGCVPLVLVLVGPLARGQAPVLRLLAAGLTVSAGAVAAQWAGGTTAAGVLFSLGALAGEAAFSLLAAPLLPRLGPLALSTYVCICAAAVLAVGAAGARLLEAPTMAQVAAIAYLGLAVTSALLGTASVTPLQTIGVGLVGVGVAWGLSATMDRRRGMGRAMRGVTSEMPEGTNDLDG